MLKSRHQNAGHNHKLQSCWIHLALDRDLLRGFMNTLMNLRIP